VRPPKYSLELVLELREKKVDESARAFVAAAHDREVAENRRRSSQQRCEAHTTEADRARKMEQDALARGDLTAADLSRAASWEVRVAHESRTLARELSGALAGEASARAAEGRARQEVASRKAESELVVNHRERWREGLQKRKEAREEEAYSEAWRPRANKKP
jgi:hypothetical protein